ncbi:MAG: 50S ribosomal protein L10 [Thermoplasmatota archaeon]
MTEAKHQAHVAPWKEEEVARLTRIIEGNQVIAIAEIGGIPAPQMQQMRANLRGSKGSGVLVVGSKNRLLKIALQEAAKGRPGLAGLVDTVHGQSVILATNQNPFKLFKNLKAGASMAPLKGGQTSPVDVHVKKGNTPFGPGPIVGELQKVGIPAKIEAGKVVIQKDVTPVKAGQVVSAELAGMLAKLEIKPVELKIDLKAAFEKDTLFLPAALAVDETVILGQLGVAVRTAFEVSLQRGWITAQTADALLGRAYKQAIALILEQNVPVDAAVEQTVTADYAKVLASIGKKESDLTEELKKRLGENLKILNQVATAAPAAAAGSSPAPAEEKPEEKGVSEDEAAAGLGALFG